MNMKELDKILSSSDADGLALYDFLVNNTDLADEEILALIGKLTEADTTGQFVASAARYLQAIDPERFRPEIDKLINAAIDKDRERAYIPALLATVWGPDYMERSQELRETDDNFRRIFKRVYPEGAI